MQKIDGSQTTQLPEAGVFDAVLVNAAGSTKQVEGSLFTSIVAARVGPTYELRSELYGDLSWNDGAVATVWGDPDEQLRGTYRKAGSFNSGSWKRVGPLPPSSLADAKLGDVVEYLESELANLAWGIKVRGEWTPSGAFPAGAAQGDAWISNGAGTVNGVAFALGDMLVAVKANPSSAVYAANWVRIPRPIEAVRYCDTIAALKAVPKSAGAMTVRGYAAAGDGGGGAWYVKDQNSSKAEVPGLYVVADDGAGWERIWDGRNFNAAWVGCTPAVADLGTYFALFPKYCEIHFAPGKYTVATYPTEAAFSDKLYRGVSVIWNCTGALTTSQAAFTWHYSPSANFGVDGANNNNSDMTHAGVSPIEGIGIISALGRDVGIGFQMTNGYYNNYYLRPQKFSIGGFRIGWRSAVPQRNFFLLGLEDVVIKGCRIGVVIDNANSNNSGENIWLRRCYIGNCDQDGVFANQVQMLTLEGTSLDYNRRHMRIVDTLCKLQNCYLETNAGNTPAEMISVEGVAKLTIDGQTNIYGLPVAAADVFAVSGIASIVCDNTSVFMSQGVQGTTNLNRAPLILYNGSEPKVFGRITGGNGNNFPPMLSKHQSLFADPEFAIGSLKFCPGSVGASVSTEEVRAGRTYSAKVSQPLTDRNGQIAFHRMKVEPSEWLFFMFFDKVVGTIVNLAHRLQYFTAEGIQIGGDRYIGGQTAPTGFTNFPGLIAPDGWTSSAHDWRLQRAVSLVPAGADYVLAQLRVDPNSPGAYYVSDYYVYQ